jgi:hypothetical protein
MRELLEDDRDDTPDPPWPEDQDWQETDSSF